MDPCVAELAELGTVNYAADWAAISPDVKGPNFRRCLFAALGVTDLSDTYINAAANLIKELMDTPANMRETAEATDTSPERKVKLSQVVDQVSDQEM